MKTILVSDKFEMDCSLEKDELCFNVPNNFNAHIYLSNVEHISSLTFDIKKNSNVQLSIFVKKPINQSKIRANIGENSRFLVYYADFTVEKNHLEASVNLDEEHASCEWHLASLSSDSDDKEISVNMYHNSPLTFGRIDNYGVCKNTSKLLFSGISHIVKGCHKSASHQNAKIVIFDNECKAIAKPILKIDENDIEASHAAVVGKVSDEHIFYLTSRGLKEEEAKLLITLGYLKPILKGFNQNTQDEINKLIEGRL